MIWETSFEYQQKLRLPLNAILAPSINESTAPNKTFWRFLCMNEKVPLKYFCNKLSLRITISLMFVGVIKRS